MKAEIVIVGGGIVGASVAYHLAKLGRRDIVLLEQGRLTCGTTWHAAGLVGQMRPNRSMTRMSQYGIELYSTLEQETGLATGWKMTGCLRLATNQDRWTEFRRLATTAKSSESGLARRSTFTIMVGSVDSSMPSSKTAAGLALSRRPRRSIRCRRLAKSTFRRAATAK